MTQHTIEIPPEADDDKIAIMAGEYDVPLDAPPKTVLDLGGNFGLFSLWAAQVWPEARIVAYEPWKETAEIFRRNLRLFPTVTLREAAVRGTRGRFIMRASFNAMCRTFLGHGTGEERETECIGAAELDSYEFVKIDTEGCELEILQSLPLHKTKAIALEAHSFSDANRITAFLAGKGFALHDRRNDTSTCCALLKFLRRSETGAPKLMVAFPTYGGNSPTVFWESMFKLQARAPVNLMLKSLAGDSLVSRARNTLTAEFLQSDCTDLLFIDSDLIFSPEHVARLMQHDVDLVAGFYPKKQDGPLRWVCNAALNETEPDTNGLQEVRYMGTGFMRIRRRVFETMIKALGATISYRPDGDIDRTEFDFWAVGPYQYPDGSRRYLSEDWFFCQRWLDLGGRVYGDTRIVLKHVGAATYPLLSQHAQIDKPA